MYHIKPDKRAQYSANLIYHALKCLMSEQKRAYEEIKITEVVKQAQIGRATFYRNFDTLDDVLRFACDRRFKELHLYLQKYYQDQPSFEQSFFITPFLKFWYLDSSIIELLMAAKRIDIFIESFEKMFEQVIARFTDGLEVIHNHLDYFIAYRSGIAVNILIQWIKNNKDVSPEQLSNIIMEQTKTTMMFNLFV